MKLASAQHAATFAAILSAAACSAANIEELAAKPPVAGVMILDPLDGNGNPDPYLRAGDIIVTIDGIRMETGRQVIDAFFADLTQKKAAKLSVYRDGKTISLNYTVRTTPAFFYALPNGDAREIRPAATKDVAFDYSPIKTAPRDNWYSVTSQSQKNAGYLRVEQELKDNKVTIRTSWAFIGEAKTKFMGEVTEIYSAEKTPSLLDLRSSLGSGNPKQTTLLTPKGEGKFAFSRTAAGKTLTREILAPKNAISEACMFQIFAFMPAKELTCVHFTLVETNASPLPAYVQVRGDDKITIEGKEIPVVKMRVARPGGDYCQAWIDPATGNIVKFYAPYSFFEAELTTRENALANLPDKITPPK